MDKIMESKPMQALNRFGQALGSNKLVSALTGGMQSMMGIIMVGAICSIICALGANVFGWFTSDSTIYSILYAPYNVTMNLMGLWLVIIMGYNYGRNLQMKNPLMNAVDCTVIYILVCGEANGSTLNMGNLGSTTMFVGILLVWLTTTIEKFCYDHNIRIKMPDMVPQFLQDGFASIIPLAFSVIVAHAINQVVVLATGSAYNLATGFNALLTYPLSALNSIPGAFILVFLATALWCFGIHGTLIVFTALIPITMPIILNNNALVMAGGSPEFYPLAICNGLAIAGGTGNTLSLAIFCARSKSEQLKAVGKISLVPGWFGINEPMTFGVPIMYNPIMMIPYILNCLVCCLFSLILFKVGYLMPAWIYSSALLPMGFGSFLTTLHWQNATFDYMCIIVSGVIWYPFFKAYEKQLVAKEQAAAEEE
jgi:PTS system cellobiose-specific IIC component